MPTQWWVYIMASRSRVLYIGVTRDLHRRWANHREGAGSIFVRKYQVHRLVWIEEARRPMEAFEREKQLKGWRREKKLALIESLNPEWLDLAEEWGWTSPRAGRGTD